MSDSTWNSVYNIGIRLLYFLSYSSQDEVSKDVLKAITGNSDPTMTDFPINYQSTRIFARTTIYGQQYNIKWNKSRRKWVIRCQRDPESVAFEKTCDDVQKYDRSKQKKPLPDTLSLDEQHHALSQRILDQQMPATYDVIGYMPGSRQVFVKCGAIQSFICSCDGAISVRISMVNMKKIYSISCESVKRLIYALQYYHSLDMSRQKGQSKLMQFYYETYKDMLNDYVHFMQAHSNDLDAIYECLQKNSLVECNLNDCQYLKRRIRSSTDENNMNRKYDGDYEWKTQVTDDKGKTLEQQYKSRKAIESAKISYKKKQQQMWLSDSDNDYDSEDSDQWVTYEYEEKYTETNKDNNINDAKENSIKKEDSFFDMPPPKDDKFMLVQNVFDTLHCYLFHQYDLGWRINRKSDEYQYAMNKTEEKTDDTTSTDQQFKVMMKMIRKHSMRHQRRYRQRSKRKKNKFNIEVQANAVQQTNEDETFFDGLYRRLMKQNGVQSCETLQNVLQTEAFDSDAAEFDISEQLNEVKPISYLKSMLDDSDYETIERYVVERKLSKIGFSTGFTFYYWPYYETASKEMEDEKNIYNIQNYHGYKRYELFVKKKYDNIKQEIVQNQIFTISLRIFQQIFIKAESFYTADSVRQSEATEFTFTELHYDIEPGTKLKVSNLLSIILYTDTDTLQEAFSKTFRRNDPFEQLPSLIQRNAEYANWARLLRETVEGYGADGDKLKGPFFTGMSQVLLMPAFNIRLCGPTSTSKQETVAAGFGGIHGILITLVKTNTIQADNTSSVRGFCCSWLSAHAEEDEYLFMGGYQALGICNVRIMRTAEEFSTFVQALYIFDSVLNGHPVKDEMTKQHKHILNKLIKDSSKRTANTYKCHQYMVNSTKRLISSKKHIVLDMYRIARHVTALADLIFYDLYEAGGEAIRENWGRDNLIKPDIFEFFPNLNQIMLISCRPNRARFYYEFDLKEFLGIIDEANLERRFKIIVKCAPGHMDDRKVSWISRQCQEFEQMRKLYEEKGWKISIKTTAGQYYQTEDCLKIIKL